MIQNILLIGGTGVLSGDVLKSSLAKGKNVYILNRGNGSQSLPSGVTLLKADIKLRKNVELVLKDLSFDVVVDFISYNVDDLKNSLSIFYNKCNQFIFISSACAYRRSKEDGIITENSVLGNPEWDYSLNKVACENYLITECNKIGLNYTIVRPYITYGDTRIPYGIMPPYKWHWTLIARIQNDKPILLWDNGNAICTLTHTSDFAKGIVGLFSNLKAYNESFHIVSDETFTWKEVLNLIGKSINKKVEYVEIPSEYIAKNIPSLKGMLLGDRALDAVFDNSKIKNVVPEYKCTMPLDLGIAKTIENYRNNNYLNGIDYKWDAQMDKLIYNYLKEKNPSKLNLLNIRFTNYLNNTFYDKLNYYKIRYLPNSLKRIIDLIDRIIKRLLK